MSTGPERRVRLELSARSADYAFDRAALEALAAGLAPGALSLDARAGRRAPVLRLEVDAEGSLVAVVADVLAAAPTALARFSACGRWFYLVGSPQARARLWLGIETVPGRSPRRLAGLPASGSWLEFTLPGGTVYHRPACDCARVRIPLGREELLPRSSPLVLDYEAAARQLERARREGSP